MNKWYMRFLKYFLLTSGIVLGRAGYVVFINPAPQNSEEIYVEARSNGSKRGPASSSEWISLEKKPTPLTVPSVVKNDFNEKPSAFMDENVDFEESDLRRSPNSGILSHGYVNLNQNVRIPLAFTSGSRNSQSPQRAPELMDVGGYVEAIENTPPSGTKITKTSRLSKYKDNDSVSSFFSGVPSLLAGGKTISVSWQLSESSKDIRLELSIDGGLSFVELETLTETSGTYLWIVPLLDVTETYLRITSSSEVLQSNAFSIDSTPPALPLPILISPVLSNSNVITFLLPDCSETPSILVSLVNTSPSETDQGWIDCKTTANSSEFSLSSDDTVNFYVFAKDEVGNVSAASLPVTFTYDSTPPLSINIERTSDEHITNRTVEFTSMDCSDTPYVLFKLTDSMPVASDLGWQSCDETPGGMSMELPNADGHYDVYSFTKDLAGNVSIAKFFNVQLDRTPPVLNAVIINPSLSDPDVGDEYTATIFVNVLIKFTEENIGASYFVKNADPFTDQCHLTSPTWVTASGSGNYQLTHGFQLFSGDGVKKICVWAKDLAGNISSLSSALGTDGVDTDTIKFEIGNPPQITLFTAENETDHSTAAEAGEAIKLNWNIMDVEGLSNNPVTLEYTTDNVAWLPLRDFGNAELVNYGGLMGFPLNYDHEFSVPAPSSGFFRLRLKALDRAGNDSITAYSPSFNTSPWEIYAGSTDVGAGLSATSTRIKNQPNGSPSAFAVNPVTGDFYIRSVEVGILKIDVRTGKSSVFLKYGSSNLPVTGTLNPAIHRANEASTFKISQDGTMYLSVGNIGNGRSSGRLYRISLSTLETELFAGLGTDYTSLDDPYNINWSYGTFALDEESSVYGFLHCSSSFVSNDTTSAFKLIKITKNRVITHIAGDCTRANPGAGPLNPLTSPVGIINNPSIGSIAAKDNGNVIAYKPFGSAFINKIINGSLYLSSLNVGTGAHFAFSPGGELIVATGSVRKVSLSLIDGNDTFQETIVGSDYTLPACQDDGKLASEACAISYFDPGFSKSGQLMYMDGAKVTAGNKPVRLRYVNADNKVTTLAGTPVTYGQGFDKSVFQGSITSIEYQRNPNPDFPEGLYISSAEAMATYYVDPVTNIFSRVLGNEVGMGTIALDGVVVDETSNFGVNYSNGADGGLLSFAHDGYPYLKLGSAKLIKILPGKIGKIEMTGSGSNSLWDNVVPGTDPINSFLYVFGGTHNLTLKGDGLFLLGVAAAGPPTSGNNSSSLRFMDFMNNQVVHIMGGNGTNAYSSDVLVDSDLRSLNLNTTYSLSNRNYTQYDPTTDRLYFVENQKKLRYITSPGSHSSKLITLIDFEGTGISIWNFTVRPDSSAIFYVRNPGRVYCYDLGTAPAACDNTTPLGPTAGLPLLPQYAPNQFTWKDNDTLFVHDGSIIMKYNIPL